MAGIEKMFRKSRIERRTLKAPIFVEYCRSPLPDAAVMPAPPVFYTRRCAMTGDARQCAVALVRRQGLLTAQDASYETPRYSLLHNRTRICHKTAGVQPLLEGVRRERSHTWKYCRNQ